MRALAAGIARPLLTIAAFAASPQVQAALRAFQTLGADANRMKTFCELTQIEQENAAENAPPSAKAKMNRKTNTLSCDSGLSAFESLFNASRDSSPAEKRRLAVRAG
jgi:hypothetical protein